MKKIFLSVFIITFVMIGLSGCTGAAPVVQQSDYSDPYIPVVIRQADGALTNTQLSGYVRKHEALVPLSIVADYLKRDYALSTEGSGLYFNIATPPFEMETSRPHRLSEGWRGFSVGYDECLRRTLCESQGIGKNC